jgi:hypothetical protein
MPATNIPFALRAPGLKEETSDVPIVLVMIEHAAITAELGGPLRLSSDPTHTFSEDPYIVGTRVGTTWWWFLLMNIILPDDRRDSPPACQIVFENVDREMSTLVRAVNDPAEVTLYLTTSSDPDLIEERYTGLSAVRASIDESRITIDLSRENFTSEMWPSRRITKLAFPGNFV